MNLIHVQKMLRHEASKDKVIQLIQEHGPRCDMILEHVERRAFKDDIDIVRAALSSDVRNIQFASDRLKNDKTLATELILRQWSVLRYLGNEIRGNRDMVLLAIYQNGMAIQYANYELLKDKEFIEEEIIQQNPDVVEWLKHIVE
jgi:hypothetical protein